MTKDELYRETACVRIKKGAGRSLKAGGAWIYDNEIDTISGEYKDGDLVTAEDFDGYPLGHGFINTQFQTDRSDVIQQKGMLSLMMNFIEHAGKKCLGI